MHKLDILYNDDLLKALTQQKGEQLTWLEMKDRLDVLYDRYGRDIVSLKHFQQPGL